MAKRNNPMQSEHDKVLKASVDTYSEMLKKGYKVSINPGSEKNISVGSESSLQYPDVVVWKPYRSGAATGKAYIIEEIETSDSVTEEESKQWKDYSLLEIDKFILVVPKKQVFQASQIVKKKEISVNEIWYYYFKNNTVRFSKYKG